MKPFVLAFALSFGRCWSGILLVIGIFLPFVLYGDIPPSSSDSLPPDSIITPKKVKKNFRPEKKRSSKESSSKLHLKKKPSKNLSSKSDLKKTPAKTLSPKSDSKKIPAKTSSPKPDSKKIPAETSSPKSEPKKAPAKTTSQKTPIVTLKKPLPVVSTEDNNPSPILKNDKIQTGKAITAATVAQENAKTQNAITTQDKTDLAKIDAQESAAKTAVTTTTKTTVQDAQTVKTDETELTRATHILEQAQEKAKEAQSNVDTLKKQKQSVTESITTSQKTIAKTQQEISALKAQIKKTALPPKTISTLKTQLQEKNNLLATTHTKLLNDQSSLKTLTASETSLQSKRKETSKDLNILKKALVSDKAALEAAQNALHAEHKKLAVVENLARSYAAQATIAKGALQTAKAQEKATAQKVALSNQKLASNAQKVSQYGGNLTFGLTRKIRIADQEITAYLNENNLSSNMNIINQLYSDPDKIMLSAPKLVLHSDSWEQYSPKPQYQYYYEEKYYYDLFNALPDKKELSSEQSLVKTDTQHFNALEKSLSDENKLLAPLKKDQADINTDTSHLSKNTQQISEDEASLTSDTTSLESLRPQITTDQNTETLLSASLSSDKRSVSSLDQTIAQDQSLKPIETNDQTRLAQLQAENKNQTSLLSQQTGHLTDVNKQLNAATSSLQEAHADVQQETQSLSESQDALQKAKESLTTAQRTETTATEVLKTLQSQVITLQETVSQNQEKLTQLQTIAQQKDDIVTTLQTQQSHLEKEIQKQASLYEALVAQAKQAKQAWDNTGSLSALNHYNTIVHKIDATNAALQALGGYTLPDLSFLTPNQTKPPSDLPSNQTEASSDTTPEPLDEEEHPDDAETAQELDAQGDERDDTRVEKRQDISGGFMPIPGLAAFFGAQKVTENQTN